ncbi:hypothetical protein FHR92_003000 [Fontibacillus solani]|uniref:Uncharacterized protein n=1 Tax=Fontibacillus solani TaxID=1572857 RepID=A0A7W3XSA1_9BACL|nr:hypothetical protein [Fontibacillus solani]MBA9086522.1 hypothetical protein [Fontibacillus solani]
MAVDEHVSQWFLDEFRRLQGQGKTGDELRVAMYDSGISYLKHVLDNESLHWNAKKRMLKMY